MLALVLSMGANAQTSYKIEGNKIVAVSNKKETKPARDTGYVYSVNGIDYPVYISERGALFIIRKNKTTGKEYRASLPKEAREELKRRMK